MLTKVKGTLPLGIMLALYSMLLHTYYAHFNASIIHASLLAVESESEPPYTACIVRITTDQLVKVSSSQHFVFAVPVSQFIRAQSVWQNFYYECTHHLKPYLLDQMLLPISRCSRIVTAPPDVLKQIVAALEY